MFHGGNPMSRVAIFALVHLFFLTAYGAEPEVIPGEFLVKLRAEATTMSVQSFEKMLNSEVLEKVSENSGVLLVRRPIVEEPNASIARFKENKFVEYAEPNYVLRISKVPNDSLYEKLWGMNNTGQPDPKDPGNAGKVGKAGIDIAAEKAWEITTGSKDIVVGIIDTGIDHTHPDLMQNMWINAAEKNGKAGVDDDKNGFVDDVHGWDFVNNRANGKDDHGHGTHCAGTIGGVGDNKYGVAGVNWNVRLMALKFLSAQGSGSTAGAIKAIDYAVMMGANLTSNSWGGGGSSQALKEAIERAAKANQLFVAAAGNDSSDNDDSPTYPASYDVDNIVAVAAINNKGDLATFSNWGHTTVDIAAPGVSIMSSLIDNKFDIYSGTSMATPHVAGVAALVLSVDKELTYKQLKERLLNTVKKLPGLKTRTITGGMVNAYNAVTNTVPGPDPNDPENWKQETVSISTEHPYLPKMAKTYEIKIPGAKKVAAYFDRFEVEREFNGVAYDKAEFYDAAGTLLGTWTGYHSGEYSPVAEGDTIIVKLITDDSYHMYGFDITKAGALY